MADGFDTVQFGPGERDALLELNRTHGFAAARDSPLRRAVESLQRPRHPIVSARMHAELMGVIPRR
jgi:hypothetical protein